MKWRLFIWLIVINTAVLTAQTSEEAVNLIDNQQGFGIRSEAMGSAYTGLADDYSAIYWNPAGLGLVKETEFTVGFFNKTFNSSIRYGGNTTEADRSFSGLQHIGLAYAFPTTQGSLTLAFGYQRVKSLDDYAEFSAKVHGSNDWGYDTEVVTEDGTRNYYYLPFDTLRQEEQSISNEGNIRHWSIGASMEFSKDFFVGLTLNFYGGTAKYKKNYFQEDIDDNNSFYVNNPEMNHEFDIFYNYYDAYNDVKTDYSGFEARLGAMYNINSSLRVGATVVFPMTIIAKEEWSADDLLSYDVYDYRTQEWNYYDSEFYEEGIFEYHIVTPFKFSAGLSSKILFLTLAASAEYVDWSQTEFEAPDDTAERDYREFLEQNEDFRENFRPTTNINLGAEATLTDMLALRAGFRYLPTPLKDMGKKYDKKYFTFGVGLNFNETTALNASYSLGVWEVDKIYEYPWNAADYFVQTSEKFSTSRIMVGLNVKF
jgi:long-subunit fatty acid transport protein